jgi:hypothetical protein
MAHAFDWSVADPYAEAAHHVEAMETLSQRDYERDAEQNLYETLANAIVNALGDVAARAFRQGASSPDEMKHLAKAIAQSSEKVLLAYRGEVDPEPALQALENDPRRGQLPPEARDKLGREIETTRELERLLLNAKRLPDLYDYAGGLGLRVPDELMESGTQLLGGHPTPNAEHQGTG